MPDSERKPPLPLVAPTLAVLLAVALFAPLGAASVAASSPSAASTTDQPAFGQDRIVEHRGDVATVGVDVGNRSNVTLRVEPTETSPSQYTAEVIVSDRNGDGRVDVRLNTYAMGHEAQPISASGTDAVYVRQSTDLNHRLRVGEYRLTLESGNQTVAESTFVVKPAVLESLRVRTANGSQPANLSSQAAIETAIENGSFEDDRRFSTRDTLLVELEASGLSGALASQSGPNATEKFLNLLDQPGYSLTIQEWYASVDTEEWAAEFELTLDATTVVADPANDTYYVLLNAARMPRHERGKPDEFTEVEDGDVFRVNVTVGPSSGVYETGQSLTSQVTFINSITGVFPIGVSATTNQMIEISSNLTSAQNVRVVLRSDDGWYRSARTVEVNQDGTIVATFDLSDRSQGEKLTLAVEHERLGVLYSRQNAVHVRWPTLSPSPTPTRTATPDPTERTPTGTPGSAPGFGMGAALVALAVSLVVAGRRRR